MKIHCSLPPRTYLESLEVKSLARAFAVPLALKQCAICPLLLWYLPSLHFLCLLTSQGHTVAREAKEAGNSWRQAYFMPTPADRWAV